MQHDTIELKWGIFDELTNRQGKDLLQLVRYKEAGEDFSTFLQQSKGYHLALHYFINGYSFTDYCNSLQGKVILEHGNYYLNTLSFNLRPKSLWYDETLAWERLTLKKLLCLPLTLEDVLPTLRFQMSSSDSDEKKLENEIADSTMLYGCGCKDIYCGGWDIRVSEVEESILWDINIRNHRKYVFEKQAYHSAFQEIRTYIEQHTGKVL